jgi:hypothetical protein
MYKQRHMSELPNGFVTASHSVHFGDDDARHCDVCAGPLEPGSDGETDGHGHEVSGRGLLVWTRGEERRYQEPPLCPGCAAAIGLTALSRWEIEEEEG